jgi:hypothetical protein
MAKDEKKDENPETGSTIMKVVETIAISPEDAREIVRQYAAQARQKHPDRRRGD